MYLGTYEVVHSQLFLQVKIAYINFLNHCYVDTEVEMKEIYTSNHMWKLFENFLVDICRVNKHTSPLFHISWLVNRHAGDMLLRPC